MLKKIYVSKNKKTVGVAVYNILDLDTEILGFKTGKILSLKAEDNIKRILIKKLIDCFKKEKIEYATFRINAKDLSLINLLEEEGFRIVDGYLVLMKEIDNGKEEDLGIKIRASRTDDITRLQDEIASTFIYSRFFKDPVIPLDSAIKMFKLWIENCIKGHAAEKVYVAEIDEQPVGFIALETKRGVGHISLIGVSPKFRGKRISGALTSYAVSKWFKKKGVALIRIETQFTNIPATRAYESIGFKSAGSFLTLRWTTKT